MTFLEEYRAERIRHNHTLDKAGINPDRLLWHAKIRNAWRIARHAWLNVHNFKECGIVEITQPGDVYRGYQMRGR